MKSGVPRAVDPTLDHKEALRTQSLNEAIIDEPAHATIDRNRGADFSGLVGQWIPDPVFDEIVASQRQIDRDKWK